MAAPNVTYSVSGSKVSSIPGYDKITVTFSADQEYTAFICRATRVGEDWGLGIGDMIASFSSTPANAERSFDIYDTHLIRGEGEYQITLYVQGVDGSWSDRTLSLLGDTDFYVGDAEMQICDWIYTEISGRT